MGGHGHVVVVGQAVLFAAVGVERRLQRGVGVGPAGTPSSTDNLPGADGADGVGPGHVLTMVGPQR